MNDKTDAYAIIRANIDAATRSAVDPAVKIEQAVARETIGRVLADTSMSIAGLKQRAATDAVREGRATVDDSGKVKADDPIVNTPNRTLADWQGIGTVANRTGWEWAASASFFGNDVIDRSPVVAGAWITDHAATVEVVANLADASEQRTMIREAFAGDILALRIADARTLLEANGYVVRESGNARPAAAA